MSSIDSNFKRYPGRYFAQVGLTTAALFLVLWIEHIVAGAETARALLLGAIASTAFILFVSPHRPAAAPRRVLGSYGWSILVAGSLSTAAVAVGGEGWEATSPLVFSLVAAVMVGGAILAMAITGTEHAPAAGTALAIAGSGFNWQLVLFVVTSILILSGVHSLVRHHLIDLY